MRLNWAAALAAVVLLAVPFAQATFEITPTAACTPNGFKWASSAYPAVTEAGGYTFGSQDGMTLDGPQYFTTTAAINNAGDYTELYAKECAAKDIKIKVPVPNGHYQVTLLESEIYFTSAKDDDVNGCPRVFSICTEDYMSYSDLCLFKNGVNRGIALAKTYYVDDGSIDIHLWSTINMPKLGGVIVQGLDCPGNEKQQLKTDAVLSMVCINAGKGIFPVVAEASPKVVVEASPKVVVEASPKVVVEASPKVVVEASPKVVVEASPKVVVEASPKVVVEASPKVVVEASPKVVVEASPKVVVKASPKVVVEASPKIVVSPSPMVAEASPKVVAAASPKKPVAPIVEPGTNTTANGTTDGETPAAPGTNGTTPAAPGATNGTTNSTESPAAPGTEGPVLPAGPPVPITTTRDLPKLPGNKAAIGRSVTQYATFATAPEIGGAPDGKTWPTEAAAPADSTASATFAVPVSPKDLTLDGNFTKGDKVNVTVSGPGANGTTVSRDLALTAPATGTSLPVPVPKGTTAEPTPVTVSGVRVNLPAGSMAKIDAIKLDGALAATALTEQESYDNTTGTLIQWPTSASDSAGSPGLGGVGTGSVYVPDGVVWAPAGNGTRDLTLNYNTPVPATHLLLAAAPKKGATLKVTSKPSDGSAPVELYSGPATGDSSAASAGTYGTYIIPFSSTGPNLSSVTLSTDNPTALALDSAALIGTQPTIGVAGDQNGVRNVTLAPGSRSVTLPIADGQGEWATSASTGAAVLPASGVVPDSALNGTDASAATGAPDGKTFAIPASVTRGLPLGSTPYLSLEYTGAGKKANIVAVAGKAVAPGTLRASVIDADGKIIDLGAQPLPTPSNNNMYINFTTPNNDIITVKKVILTPTPAGSFVTDAVELNTASPAAIAASKGITVRRKSGFRHYKIRGSRAAFIAVVTCGAALAFLCCCCCVPFLLLKLRGGKDRGSRGAAGASTGTYRTPATKGAGLFGFLKRKPAAATNKNTGYGYTGSSPV